MSNVKKSPTELRALASELTEKAKLLLGKADLLEQEEELELLKAIKKAGKLEAVKLLLSKPDATPVAVNPKAAFTTAADHQTVQLETLMTASFDDIK